VLWWLVFSLVVWVGAVFGWYGVVVFGAGFRDGCVRCGGVCLGGVWLVLVVLGGGGWVVVFGSCWLWGVWLCLVGWVVFVVLLVMW